MTTGLSALPALCLAQLQCTPPPRAPPPSQVVAVAGLVLWSALVLVCFWFWSGFGLLWFYLHGHPPTHCALVSLSDDGSAPPPPALHRTQVEHGSIAVTSCCCWCVPPRCRCRNRSPPSPSQHAPPSRHRTPPSRAAIARHPRAPHRHLQVRHCHCV